MLCALAHSFPPRIAGLLERDRGLTRNFREETVTDLLMASLVGLEPFGVQSSTTRTSRRPGETWSGFSRRPSRSTAAVICGSSFKRSARDTQSSKAAAIRSMSISTTERATQAQTLVGHAAATPATLPLYIFYHPSSALAARKGRSPAIEGINLVFASLVAPVVKGGCAKSKKLVAYCRNQFLPLSDILCWPAFVSGIASQPADSARFSLAADSTFSASFHPDLVARRLMDRWERTSKLVDRRDAGRPDIRAADGIPTSVRRAIDGEVTSADRKQLRRPRVIFSTIQTAGDPGI